MSNSDDNTIGRRAKRYARVGSTVGGLAAKFVGSRYLGLDFDKEKHASELTAALGGLKGRRFAIITNGRCSLGGLKARRFDIITSRRGSLRKRMSRIQI